MKQIYILLIALLMGLSANAEESGTCGPDLRWYLTNDGVLTISGKGEMYDYSDDNRELWYEYVIERIIIGDGVTTIGENAFRDCSNLTSVTIPNSITEIGGRAFEGCFALTSVTIPNSVTTIGENAFRDCSNLTSVTIPNSVTEIGFRAFSSCSSLTSVTIPNSITEIGDYTFSDCRELTSVTIPNSVTKIDGRAFANCSSLKNFTFGSGLQSIGQEAFSGCINITQISSEAVVPPACRRNALDGINKSKCKIIVPKNSLDAYKQADQWKDFFFIDSTTGITNTVYNNSELADVYTIGNKTAK